MTHTVWTLLTHSGEILRHEVVFPAMANELKMGLFWLLAPFVAAVLLLFALTLLQFLWDLWWYVMKPSCELESITSEMLADLWYSRDTLVLSDFVKLSVDIVCVLRHSARSQVATVIWMRLSFITPQHMSLGTIKTLLYVITVHIVMVDGDFGFQMDRHERFGVSRDLLLSLRCAAPQLPENVCQTVKQLGCARRGCRAGRLVQVRRRRAAMTYIETNDDDGRKIPVLTSQRTVNKDDLLYRNSQRNTKHCLLIPITTSDSCQSNHTVERRVDGRSLLPTYYLLNPTSIAKDDTFDQIKVDIASLNVDVLLLCETWLKPTQWQYVCYWWVSYISSWPSPPGRWQPLCIRNTYDSCLYKFDSTRTACLPADIELMWIHVTSRFSGDVKHVVGLCYHPPKPLYVHSAYWHNQAGPRYHHSSES